MEKIRAAVMTLKNANLQTAYGSLFVFVTQEAVGYAPSCSEACGGVISLDPPPPDTTAEPGGNQIVSDSHPLRMMQHKPLVFALHYFSPTHLPFTGGNAGKHTPVLPLAGGMGSCTLVSPPARTVIVGPRGN